MEYYALENVVYKSDGEVACVIAPVWLLKYVAFMLAEKVANDLNSLTMDERDVLRGSLD